MLCFQHLKIKICFCRTTLILQICNNDALFLLASFVTFGAHAYSADCQMKVLPYSCNCLTLSIKNKKNWGTFVKLFQPNNFCDLRPEHRKTRMKLLIFYEGVKQVPEYGKSCRWSLHSSTCFCFQTVQTQLSSFMLWGRTSLRVPHCSP